ncbi:MAG: TSUP family transporter [Phycisphaerae bacterium]|nr:TSUP family transporter [Phycisphaerae bacterium]
MIPILALAALLTATLSGIIGMGGGMLLLATMFCFLPYGQAVPLHAVVQLVSNSTRIVVFWKNVDKRGWVIPRPPPGPHHSRHRTRPATKRTCIKSSGLLTTRQ